MDTKRLQFSISILALVVALGSAVTTAYLSYTSIKTSVKPILVLLYDNSSGWTIRNVGNGPALDILVACTIEGQIAWQTPVRVYPIERNGEVALDWMGHIPDKIGISYKSANETLYTSTTNDDLTTFREGNQYDAWNERKILRIWEAEPQCGATKKEPE